MSLGNYDSLIIVAQNMLLSKFAVDKISRGFRLMMWNLQRLLEKQIVAKV